MLPFSHTPGDRYRIREGVRRAKAAQIHGHRKIRAEVIDQSGKSLGEGEIPLDALESPKRLIRRVTETDEMRWTRADEGARETILPFPPIVVQPTTRQLTPLVGVEFDFGDVP